MLIFFPWERLPVFSGCRFRPPGLPLVPEIAHAVDDDEPNQDDDQQFEHSEKRQYDFF
jgi:hypothetical protein